MANVPRNADNAVQSKHPQLGKWIEIDHWQFVDISCRGYPKDATFVSIYPYFLDREITVEMMMRWLFFFF